MEELLIILSPVILALSVAIIIYFLEHKCQHEYKIIDKIDLCWEKEITGTLYILQCTKCGKIKTKKIH